MNILLTGANGFIGAHLLKALLQQGHQVTACVHRQPKHNPSGATLHYVDFAQITAIDQWINVLESIDLVINSVGIIRQTPQQTFEQLHYLAPAYLFLACQKVGIQQVIQLSALGADDRSTIPYQQTKGAADRVLNESELGGYILRPSLVYGDGGQSFHWFQRMSNFPLICLLEQGEQLIQPIHISDLVATVLQCIRQPRDSVLSLNLVGQCPITYRQWLLRLRTRPYRPIEIHLSQPWMMRLLAMGHFLNPDLMQPDNMLMLSQDNCAEVHPLESFLNRSVLTLAEGLQYDLSTD